MGIDESQDMWRDVSKLYANVENIVPQPLSPHLNITDQLTGHAGLNASARQFLGTIEKEGAALAQTLGEDFVYAKIPDLTPAQLADGIKSTGSLEKFAAYLHIRDFLGISQRLSQIELLNEMGACPPDNYASTIKNLTSTLDASGHNGFAKLLTSHPSLKEKFCNDATTFVTVDHALGETRHGNAIQSFVRQAYLAGEEKYAATLGEMAEKYMDNAYMNAAGKHYIEAFQNKKLMVESIASKVNAGSLRLSELSTKELVAEMAKQFRPAGQSVEEFAKQAAAAGHEYMVRHGLAITDAKFFGKMGEANCLSPELLAGLDSTLFGGSNGKPTFMQHVADKAASFRTAASGTTNEKPSPKVTSIEGPESSAQKKTPQMGEGSSSKKSATRQGASSGGSSGGHPPTTGTSASHGGGGGGVNGGASGERFIGTRLFASAIFGGLIYDGLSNIKKSSPPALGKLDTPEGATSNTQNSNISFARVAEASVGAIGLVTAWLTKNESLQKLWGRGFQR
ncbi:MAG: hypothetical protein ACK52W_07675 [Alphaproteobacteria bacterium]